MVECFCSKDRPDRPQCSPPNGCANRGLLDAVGGGDILEVMDGSVGRRSGWVLLFGVVVATVWGLVALPSDSAPSLASESNSAPFEEGFPIKAASDSHTPEVVRTVAEQKVPTGGVPPSPVVASKLAAIPIRGVHSFFFSAEAWDQRRILSSKLFNPLGTNSDSELVEELEALVGRARGLVEPMTKELFRASTSELRQLALAGVAREGAPPRVSTIKVNGKETVEISLSRPEKADVQIGVGVGKTFVAAWEELPQTKPMRVGLALTIMEQLVGLTRLLESHKRLTPEESNRIVFTAVEVATSYQ